MFLHLPKVTNLPCEPEDIIKVYRGLNMVKISVDELVSEPCETYIVTSRLEGEAKGAIKGLPVVRLQTHIVFYLESPAVRALYAYDANPYNPERRVAVEAEAADMVEQMGAILEDAGWEAMSPGARVQWLAQEYLFRTGAPRPKPAGMPGDIAAVTPPRGQAPAGAKPGPQGRAVPGEVIPVGPFPRDIGGLETNFDDLLDSAFFEEKEPAPPPSAPVSKPAPHPMVVKIPEAEVPPRAPAAAPPTPKPPAPDAPAPEPRVPTVPRPDRPSRASDPAARRILRFLAGF